MKSQVKINRSAYNKTIRKVTPLTNIQKAEKLDSFSVTHDSVVATIILAVNHSHQIIRIWWGDEGQNTQPQIIDLRKERLILGGNSLPENTFKLQHKYDEKASKRKIILVQSQDNTGKTAWDTAVIEIEPRYKFICYPVVLEFNNHFDTMFESHSEFEINMTVNHNGNTVLEEQWKESIQTGNPGGGIIFPIHFTLEGSRINLDISYSDEPILISFIIKEKDNLFKDIFDVLTDIPSDFDTSNTVSPSFHPKNYTGSKEFIVDYGLHDGTVTTLIRTEMNLIVPLDKTPEVLAPI